MLRNPGGKRLRTALLALAALAACKDVNRPDDEVAAVEVVAPSDRVEVGRSLQLEATPRRSDGAALQVTGVEWSSSDPGVASVDGDGWVVGRAPGLVTIQAAVGGETGSVSLQVVPAAVASLVLAPDTATLLVGDTRRLAATPRDAAGAELAGRAVAWSSDAAAVASVAADGTVTGHAAGTATITAESGGVKATARVTVVQPPVPALTLELVATGLLPSPAHLASPPGDPRQFVVGLDGRVWIVRSGAVLPGPFLDLRDRVAMAGEMGMFSIAFHPQYASNGQFYVAYTDRDGNTRVERYRASADPDRADPASARLVLGIDPPNNYHYGGQIGFGPDGKLYVSVGDGGSSESAQDRGSLLGKLLRIDVDAGDPYAIPSDNPFAGQAGARGEIWAMGLRNPWRWSIDTASGLVFIADVGSNFWEEVNVAPLARGGLNYGWPRMEGALCNPEPADCDRSGLTLPAVAYPHGDRGTGHPWGCSVTGGHVYRGSRMPGLRGHYFYGDFCRGWVRSFRYQGGEVADARDWSFTGTGMLVSFGADSEGELYLLGRSGTVHRVAPGAGSQ